MASPYGLVEVTAAPTVEGPHTPAALNALAALWARQQGGAIAVSPAVVVAGEVAGTDDSSPASEVPAAPKVKKPRKPYKRSENGRRRSKAPKPKIRRNK